MPATCRIPTPCAPFIRDAESTHGAAGLPVVVVAMPTALVYDVLLPGTCGEVLPC